ncbi:hypothetical protein [Sphingobium sp. B2]|uniref:hypothetical protein n=1 Tax=Sphingobium sp. B2 TaxID=2583228 RepID=UPI0011A58FA6|nr:hypothetical protein [Sphingobium sp. B2]
MTRIRLVLKPKPPPPPLPPFECAICEQIIERDPYSPDHEAPPICWPCGWLGQNRLQTHQLPVSMWGPFRAAYALLATLDKEIARARRTQ